MCASQRSTEYCIFPCFFLLLPFFFASHRTALSRAPRRFARQEPPTPSWHWSNCHLTYCSHYVSPFFLLHRLTLYLIFISLSSIPLTSLLALLAPFPPSSCVVVGEGFLSLHLCLLKLHTAPSAPQSRPGVCASHYSYFLLLVQREYT